MSAFKVQCPSCEAQVLIKNPNLVGSKVECPKCKYRFKVEAPADQPAKDAPKADKKDAKDSKAGKPEKEKKAKGGKKQNKKVIGIALAVAAVALLGIGGYVMFGGDGKPKPQGGPGTGPRPGPVANNTGDGSTNSDDQKKDDNPDKKGESPSAPQAPRSDKDPTNLLPTKSIAVYRFDIGRLRQTPVGGMLFDANTAELVKKSMGFDLGDIEQYFHCSVDEKERAPVGVIRLRTPTPEKTLAAGIAGAAAGKSVGGKTVLPVASNPLLSAAGNALAGRTLMADLYTSPPPPPAKATTYGVCVYDTQTVLVGELAALEAHLGTFRDGHPPFQTVVQKDTPPPAEAPKGMGDTPMPMTPPMPTPTAPPGGRTEPAGNKGFTTNPTYLSLDPTLRRVVLSMLAERGGEPMLVLAEKFDNAAYPRAGVKKEYAPIAKGLDPVLARTEHVGANLVSFTPRQLVANLRLFAKSDSDARAIALDHLTPSLGTALPLLSLLLQAQIDFRNYADPNYVPPAEVSGPGGVAPGMLTPGGPPPGVVSPGGPPRPGGPPPGIGGPPPGVGGPPPGLGSPPPGGLQPSFGPPPGFGSPMGPMMRPMGEVPGGPMDPNQPARAGLPPSFVSLRLVDQAVSVGVEFNWPEETYSRLLAPRLLGVVNQLKGKAAVYAGTETWHALGRAVKQYVAERKEYPPGTVPVNRPNDQDARLGVSYPPAQRASFFVELLPALGRGGLRQAIDPALGWLSDRNAPQAGSWVPELLVSYYPQSAWRATSPLAPDFTFGGTNFVAVAGVGPDAPRYNPKSPADAKKVGITGYDWGSKLEEVTDGPENTIYLLQVPPGAPRPWAAGGGATVVGLDPKDPMAAFKHTRPDGKQGTYAVMGDGTVRWLPADIPPQTMLDMATRAGGEKLPDLDEVAPRVLPAGAKAELKASAPKRETPKSDAPVAAPPTQAPKTDATPAAPTPREKADPPAKKQ